MSKKQNYVIPEGTLVRTRNVKSDLILRRHRTKRELRFDDQAITADGGSIVFFEFGDWLILVESEDVLTGESHEHAVVRQPVTQGRVA